MKKLAALIIATVSVLFSEAQEIKKYTNYNFVPGDKIIFEDDLSNAKIGQTPINWNLEEGGVVVDSSDEKYISITKYYTRLTPKIKGNDYLPDSFTVEFDSYLDAAYDGNPGVVLGFRTGDEEIALLTPNKHQSFFKYPGGERSEDTPASISGDDFFNKWNHIAFSYINKKVSFYINQEHIMTIENVNFKATTLVVRGDASENTPMYFNNFKIARYTMNGIDMSMSKGKFVTQAIKFDVNKAIIKLQSMGVLNEVAKYLRANAGKKFEIGGYTDSDGDNVSNQKLSDQRAQAVKDQLVSMGVSSEQLTTKGYGETNPIAPNTTSEGKANNRRVEFVVSE